MKKVLISTGDIDGIGLEVTAKALSNIGPQRGIQFVLMRSSYQADRWINLIKKRFQIVNWQDELQDIEHHKFNYQQLIDINSKESPVSWFYNGIKYCEREKSAAIVTGPISKPLFFQSGWSVTGHTGLLKKVCKTDNLFMAFLGSHFNVVLATDHIPLKQVANTLNPKLLNQVLKLCCELRSSLTTKLRPLPIGVLGLNPHSGDSGIIGTEESLWLDSWVQLQQKKKINLQGPLVPDSAFQKKFWNQYSIFMALYHDQGLIPFKSIHGQDSGVHITLGLPFLRASVDHGTGKDIFNKNCANSSSMREAIKYVISQLKRGN